MKKIVYISDRIFPFQHSYISFLLEDYLPRHFDKVIIFGISRKPLSPKENLEYIYSQNMPKNPLFKNLIIKNLIKKNLMVFQDAEYVYIRNLTLASIYIKAVKKINPKITAIYQISHLHAEGLLAKKWSIIYTFQAYIDLYFRRKNLQMSDKNLFISEQMFKNLYRENNLEKKLNFIVPLGIDKNKLPNLIDFWERTIDVAYIGTLDQSRRINVLVDAVEYYNQNLGSINMQIWPSNEPKNITQIRKYITKKNMESYIHVNESIERDLLIEKLTNVKVGLVAIPPENILNTISPIKLMDYIISGCAIIGSKGIPEIENFVSKKNIGALIEFNYIEIAKGINYLLNNFDHDEYNNSRNEIINERDYDKIIEPIFK